ncbi:MAG: hypothetical protein J0I41_06300 [Filimonas sp.]|nr:hypothetical protein [Filimonas sp.]
MPKHARRLVFALGLLAGLSFEGNAQKQLDSSLMRLSEDYQQERVYLHFDKNAYAPGETIWFKAYLQAGVYPSDISKNFYVDWTDASGNILFHTAAPILDATAKGQFEIPATFTGQVVHVRAYTQWMLNFDSSFLYNKDLRILQKDAKPVKDTKLESAIQFFPESGDLIAGIKSKVAFKANDQWGKPVNVKGGVYSASGEKIDTFTSQHDGMGSFTVEAKAGEKYNVKWTDELNTPHISTLPDVKTTGVILKMNGLGQRKGFLVERSADAPANLKTLYVVATIQQQLVYRAKVDLSESVAIGGSIPTGTLPSGVMLISVFDADWVPVAERICFINNHNYDFGPQVAIKGNTARRAKNTIEIEVPDSIAANMSISVTDGEVAIDKQNTIVSHLLLSSELKGYVNNPAYYFNGTADSLQQHLDLVMMTNGWRKINWEKIVRAQMPRVKYQKDTSFMSFSGKVFGATPLQLREAGQINLIFKGKDSSTSLTFLPIKPDGSFSDRNMLFFDTLTVYYQFNQKRDLSSRVAVSFNNGLYPPPQKVTGLSPMLNWVSRDTSGYARLRMFASEQERLKKLLESTTLSEVTVKTRAKKPIDVMDEKYTSGLFSGGNARQFDVTEDPIAQASMNVLNYLQGRVAGLQISSQGANSTATWRGSSTSFYIDEMSADADRVTSLPMSDVAYIKVFPPPFFGGMGGGSGGAIAVYTRRGGDVKSQPGEGLEQRKIGGYTKFKEFYSPNYATDQSMEQPDVRSTIYWNPYVLTDGANRKVTIEFFNNDISKSMQVVLEGVNREGKLTRVEKTIQ